jgi:uracil-DNA glycosylase
MKTTFSHFSFMMLLNATLTVQAHNANSHSKFGWQQFTDNVIKIINEKCENVVFMLLGNFAHKKEKLVDSSKHSVLKFAHPSPLSVRHFNDCKCFSKVNESLSSHGKEKIDWIL